jgi:hypothetical protein
MWAKPCKRPGCASPVRAASQSKLDERAYCGPACRRADAPRALRERPYIPPRPVVEAPPVPVPVVADVPSPSNNVTHRRIADRQLALIAIELERIRLSRRRLA